MSKVKKTNVSWTATPDNLIIVVDGKIFNLARNSSDPALADKTQKVYNALKHEQYEKVQELLAPIKKVVKYIQGTAFTLDDNGNLFEKGTKTPINNAIAKKLLYFATEELPIQPLINFWHNLLLNPSEDSRQDLFAFLDKNHHPLTSDGCFLAYKKVQRKGNHLYDSHSGTIKNDVGLTVKMAREKVNPDRNQTCSTGLHVASYEYAQGFGGNVLVLVKVNPKDVVTVPVDYNRQKMRCCEYEVTAEMEIPKEMKEHIVDNTPASKAAAKKNASQNFVTLKDKSARQIVEDVKKLTKVFIATSLKNKQQIVKQAKEILTKHNYTFDI